MKEYFYKDIQEITKEGILFNDGYQLLFEECRNEWCKINNIEANQSSCVAAGEGGNYVETVQW